MGNDRLVTAREGLERRLRTMAMHDALTGLPNRRALLSRLDAACRYLSGEPGRRCTLVRINVDRFHLLNTSMGYACGDDALIQFGQRLRAIVDSAEWEVRELDLPACLGGDEFAMLVAGPNELDVILPNLRERVSAPLLVGGKRVHCAVSMGVVDGTFMSTPQELLRDAETALSRAKRQGGARSVRFEPWMQKDLEARAALEEDLRGAVDRGEIFAVFQPVVSLTTGRPVGCEALLRWRHPVRGLISPGEFIPIAEESDVIVQLGEFAMARAAEQLRALDDAMSPDVSLWMSVNVSKRQLHEANLAERLTAIAGASGVEPGRIKLEVTESIVMEDLEKVPSVLERLKKCGFGLAMDDFGTGQSSLSCLRRFPVDTLKIDRSFISGIGPDRQYAAVVNAIINLAHNLGMTVVAEGIEERDQVAQLQALECDQGQGYLFAKPLESAALAGALTSLCGRG